MAAIRAIVASTKLEQHNDHAILESFATVEQIKAIFAAHNPAAAALPATPPPTTASKH
jgi:hypothetical protein